jgi:hypothetical protein
LAHVDAGKTTLTERLLQAAGVIGEIGSVDDGSTQTDSLALERQRGITIKSAVVSFAIGAVAGGRCSGCACRRSSSSTRSTAAARAANSCREEYLRRVAGRV